MQPAKALAAFRYSTESEFFLLLVIIYIFFFIAANDDCARRLIVNYNLIMRLLFRSYHGYIR